MPYVPLLSSTFPNAHRGPHKKTGYAFVRSPAATPFEPEYPTLPNGNPALSLRESAFALYYPGERKPKRLSRIRPASTVGWLPQPVSDVVAGYERFLEQSGSGILFHAVRFISGRIKFQAKSNAIIASGDKRYPLVIFSHGLAGTRNTYSRYCSALASEGYVVLSIEHHDGSGPAVIVPDADGSKSRVLLYTHYEELKWGDNKKDSTGFRQMQLEFRIREVYEAYNAFSRLVRGQSDDKSVIEGLTGSNRAKWVKALHDQVDLDDLRLTGHSFGGGTMLHLLQSPTFDTYQPLPASHVIALDPWLEAVPDSVADVTGKVRPMPPTLIINSQDFTQWKEQFPRLVDLSLRVDATLVTIAGITHQGYSDFPLLTSRQTSTALSYLRTIHNLSASFLKNELGSSPFVQGRKPDNGDFKTAKDGKLAGKRGEVLVHLVSSSSSSLRSEGLLPSWTSTTVLEQTSTMSVSTWSAAQSPAEQASTSSVPSTAVKQDTVAENDISPSWKAAGTTRYDEPKSTNVALMMVTDGNGTTTPRKEASAGNEDLSDHESEAQSVIPQEINSLSSSNFTFDFTLGSQLSGKTPASALTPGIAIMA